MEVVHTHNSCQNGFERTVFHHSFHHEFLWRSNDIWEPNWRYERRSLSSCFFNSWNDPTKRQLLNIWQKVLMLVSLSRIRHVGLHVQAPDPHKWKRTSRPGFTDVSLNEEDQQNGVPNVSARIHANARGYTDVCDCLCSYNSCSGEDVFPG